MTSIGETLRRERLRRGWNLDRVAAETKISLHLLEAIELDRFDRLPGGVFARNFVRQYARMLQLDEDETLAAFHQQFEEPVEQTPAEPEPAPAHVLHISPWSAFRDRLGPGSSLSAFAGLVIVILACAGIYSLWQKARRSPPAPETVVATPKPAPRLPVARAETPQSEFKPAEVSENGVIRPAAPAEPLPAPAKPAPETTSPVHAVLTPAEPVWVSVKTDGTRAFTGTLDAEKAREFNADQRMTLLVGSAGSLNILLNGKRIGPFGAKGEIQLLVLTPSGAHVVPRTPRTSEDSTVPTEPVSDNDRP